jgi:hypothetical protein
MDFGTSFYRLRPGAIVVAAGTLVACSNSGFGAHMRPPPTVRNSDVTLAYQRGWNVRAVKSTPGMTLREGDQLLAIDGKPASIALTSAFHPFLPLD